MIKPVVGLGLAVLALSLAPAPPAKAALLSTLIGPPGQTLTITDGNGAVLTFSNFGYSFSGTANQPANVVNVVTTTDPNGNAGLQFSNQWNENGGVADYLITYTVTSTLPIIDAHIFGNPDQTGPGHVLVTEAFFQLPSTHLSIYAQADGSVKTGDNATFGPVYRLDVTKDMLFDWGGSVDGQAALSHVDQTFSTVPEPTTVLGLGLGLGALGLARWRRRA